VTLQRRLEWVWKTYGERRPDVAFLTGEVVREAGQPAYTRGMYIVAPRTWPMREDGRVLLATPMEQLRLDAGELTEGKAETLRDAVAFVFSHWVATGRWWDDSRIDAPSRYDKLVPWIARSLASYPTPRSTNDMAYALVNTLGDIADWAEATRPDIMRLTLTQVLYRSRRWHAGLVRKAEAGEVDPGEIVFRFPDGWSVQRLATREQLKCEGGALAHCIGTVQSYGDYMLSGFADIYSMRDENGVPRYTFYIEKTTRVVDSDLSFRDVPRLSVKQVKGLRNKRPKLAKDCVKILAFLDHLGVPLTDHIDDLEHCLKKAGRWPAPVRQNRRTSRRRTSRRRAA
jgi:hypothetical protein